MAGMILFLCTSYKKPITNDDFIILAVIDSTNRILNLFSSHLFPLNLFNQETNLNFTSAGNGLVL